MSRHAIIDMGTNTFHLLVVDLEGDQSTQVYKEKHPVRLGKGGLEDGNLLPEALDRGMQSLETFSKKIADLEVDEIHAMATSAVRSSSNGKHWLEAVRTVTGIDVEVISGDREAELIWKGVRKTMPLMGKWLIVDIGGGSTEFIIADNKQVYWKRSFPLGVSRLLDKYQPGDPMDFEIELKMWDDLHEDLKPLGEQLEKHEVVQMVGSSGSFDTLRDIMLATNDITLDHALPHSIELPINLYRHWSAQIRAASEAERLTMPGMIPLRAKMMHISCLLINTLFTHADFERMLQSDFALKEGKIAELLEAQKGFH